MNNGIKSYSIENEEVGVLVEDSNLGSNIFKIHVPKIMPLVTAELTTHPESINKSIFINEVKPKCSPKVITQGYISVHRSGNASLISVSDSNGTIPKGTKLLCLVPGQNIKDIKVQGGIE